MSMTEQGLNLNAGESLPVETLACIERIKVLARRNRADNYRRLKNVPRRQKPNGRPEKLKRPPFYNPSERD